MKNRSKCKEFRRIVKRNIRQFHPHSQKSIQYWIPNWRRSDAILVIFIYYRIPWKTKRNMYHISLYWKRILASSMPSLNNRLYKPSSSIEYVNTLKTKSIDNDNTSIPSFLLQNCTNLGILMGVSQYVSVSQSVPYGRYWSTGHQHGTTKIRSKWCS